MIRMGVSGRTFLQVLAYPGSHGQMAVKQIVAKKVFYYFYFSIKTRF